MNYSIFEWSGTFTNFIGRDEQRQPQKKISDVRTQRQKRGC